MGGRIRGEACAERKKDRGPLMTVAHQGPRPCAVVSTQLDSPATSGTGVPEWLPSTLQLPEVSPLSQGRFPPPGAGPPRAGSTGGQSVEERPACPAASVSRSQPCGQPGTEHFHLPSQEVNCEASPAHTPALFCFLSASASQPPTPTLGSARLVFSP